MPKVGELKKLSRSNSNFKRERLAFFQTRKTIVEGILRAEKDSRSFSKKLVPFFKKDDDFETCRFVWLFLCRYFTYKAEDRSDQTVRKISRMIAEAKTMPVDCKHYATASIGILNACGIPAWLCVVWQGLDKRKFHAYASALVNNKVIVIDPCRKSKFNDECSYKRKWNISPIKN